MFYVDVPPEIVIFRDLPLCTSTMCTSTMCTSISVLVSCELVPCVH
jgi:hypothetical protein